MSTENETPTEVETPAVETPTEQSTEQLDSLLSEFKTEETPEETPAEQPVEQPQPQFDEAWAMEVETERQQAREEKDMAYAFSRAKEVASPYKNLPDSFSETWLRNEYMTNAELQQAWDNRLSSDEAMVHANKVMRRAMDKLDKDAKFEHGRIDAIPYTADRAAVAHAVRGNAGPAPQQATGPDFSTMTNQEINAYTKKHWGFTNPRLG